MIFLTRLSKSPILIQKNQICKIAELFSKSGQAGKDGRRTIPSSRGQLALNELPIVRRYNIAEKAAAKTLKSLNIIA